MATIFGSIGGASFSNVSTTTGGTVPSGKYWVAFYQGPAAPPGMTSLGTSGSAQSVWIGLFGAGNTLPSVFVVYIEFAINPPINTL